MKGTDVALIVGSVVVVGIAGVVVWKMVSPKPAAAPAAAPMKPHKPSLGEALGGLAGSLIGAAGTIASTPQGQQAAMALV